MKNKPDTWKRKKTEEVADCRVFKVREDFCERETDGEKSTFFVIENPDWVNIIALTGDEKVVLIEQFRHGTESLMLELPGGMLDEDEEPEKTARRELAEETGFSAGKLILLGKTHPNPAIQNNVIYHFLALNCEKTGDVKFDDHESIVTRLVPLAEMESLIEDGKVTHSLVVAAFYFLGIYRRKEE